MMTSLDDVIVCDVTLLTSFDEVNVAGYDVIPSGIATYDVIKYCDDVTPICVFTAADDVIPSDIATDDVIKYCDDVTPVRVFTVADATLPIN